MKQQTIVILGAGVGGLHCALKLSSLVGHQKNVQILLIDRQPFHVLHSTLYHAVSADLRRDKYCLPLDDVLQHHRVKFIQDSVLSIDPTSQQVSLHESGIIRYDYMVFALGSQPNGCNIPGLMEHALQFSTFEQALTLRKKVAYLVRRYKKPQIVIGGGGPAGVELAGTLAHLAQRNKAQVYLVERVRTILSHLPPAMSNYLAGALKRQKVTLRCGQGIHRVTAKYITLEDGRKLPYDLFVWTGGVKPSSLLQNVGLNLDKAGRAVVRPTLQARGFARIYVIGDAASYAVGKDQALPPMATHALRQGLHAAYNIYRQLYHRPLIAYAPHTQPTIITLGHYTGAIAWGSLVLTGRWVLTVQRLVEWWYVSGLQPVSFLRSSRSSRSSRSVSVAKPK